MPQTQLTEADMLHRAAELGPALRARRAQSLRDRRVCDATIADLVAGGFFKLLQPASLGGLELPYGAQVAISAAVAEHCGASGWLTSVVATHHWMLAKFEPQLQREVWGDDPDAIVCSAFGFTRADVKPVDGGYKVSGQWTFSSGSHAAKWAMIGIPVAGEGGLAQRKFALVPRADFTVLDNWRAVGLRGSGSNDIVVTDAFVPGYRTISHPDIDRVDSPGTTLNGGPTYRLQTFGIFNLTGVGPALGLARGALNAFTNTMKERRNAFGSKVPELQNIQMRTSEASAEIDAADAIASAHVAALQHAAMTGARMSQGEIMKLQRDCAYAGRLCQTAVGRLAEAMGAAGLYEDNEVQLNQADLKGVCAHLTMGWDANCVPYGKFLLGIEHKGLI